jgi:hypothetical protein
MNVDGSPSALRGSVRLNCGAFLSTLHAAMRIVNRVPLRRLDPKSLLDSAPEFLLDQSAPVS